MELEATSQPQIHLRWVMIAAAAAAVLKQSTAADLASRDKSLHGTTRRIRYIHDHDQQHHNAQYHHMRAQLEAVWLGAESPLTIHRAQPHMGLPAARRECNQARETRL
jgi:hypothetical protein